MLTGAGSLGIVDRDAVLVIPGHPVAGVFESLGRVFLEGRQVIERIDISQVAGVDQAHEHITDEGAMLGLIKGSIRVSQRSNYQFLLIFVTEELSIDAPAALRQRGGSGCG